MTGLQDFVFDINVPRIGVIAFQCMVLHGR